MKMKLLIVSVSVLSVLTSCDTMDSYSTLSDMEKASEAEASKKGGHSSTNFKPNLRLV